MNEAEPRIRLIFAFVRFFFGTPKRFAITFVGFVIFSAFIGAKDPFLFPLGIACIGGGVLARKAGY